MREQFTFYRSFFSAISKIKSKRDKLSIYDAIANYALNGDEIEMTDTAKALFSLIKPNLDAAAKKSEGRLNRARQAQDSGKTPSRSEQDNDNEKENEREKENKREKESYYIGDNKKHDPKSDIKNDPELKSSKRFIKPTVEEIATYCEERQNGIDAARFFNFYEAKGWKIGKSPMKDWRAAVRTWEQQDGRKKENEKMGRSGVQEHTAEYWNVKGVDIDGTSGR